MGLLQSSFGFLKMLFVLLCYCLVLIRRCLGVPMHPTEALQRCCLHHCPCPFCLKLILELELSLFSDGESLSILVPPPCHYRMPDECLVKPPLPGTHGPSSQILHGCSVVNIDLCYL